MNNPLLITLILLLSSISLSAQRSITKETLVYTSKDRLELKLDKYAIEDTITNKPCVIFMFGGGFSGGTRDNKDYLPYFHSLVENGNTVVSIDYRLGFKDLHFSSIGDDKNEFVKLFVNTITMATEDLMDATTFILYHAKDWNVDKKKIIVSGSSAGAITALHGEYITANRLEIASKLPDSFRYAGVISFAGAIFSTHGDLKWKEQPSPMMLFHGSADKNVPYKAVELGYLGFYGSSYIANQLEEMRVPYHFVDEEYGTHDFSSSPMHENLELINSFIHNQIIKKKGMRIHTTIKINGREPAKTVFSIKDYIMTNYNPNKD